MVERQNLMQNYAGGVAVRGRSHESSGLPCQDSYAYLAAVDSTWAISVVSDGAGTASRSHQSSRLLADTFLALVSAELYAPVIDLDRIKSLTVRAIQTTRESLIRIADLNEFHATFVASVRVLDSVFLIHIGDGGATLGIHEKEKIRFVRSNPENGEYANETYFFTSDTWFDHLRIQKYEKVAFSVIASDGVDPLIWDPHSGIRQKFLLPLLQKIIHESDKKSIEQILMEVLQDPRMDEVTSDDKSLVVEVLDSIKCASGSIQFLDDTQVFSSSSEDIGDAIKQELISLQAKVKPVNGSVSSNKSDRRRARSAFGYLLFALILLCIGSLTAYFAMEIRDLVTKEELKLDPIPSHRVPETPNVPTEGRSAQVGKDGPSPAHHGKEGALEQTSNGDNHKSTSSSSDKPQGPPSWISRLLKRLRE